MSLPRDPLPAIPSDTAYVAQRAFPGGNVYMRMRQELGSLFDDELFAAVYAREGQPALPPWQLALVTVMQFAENLSDRQAADAVRARIDWKYALGLELSDEGFHSSVLSAFRARLVAGGLEQGLLDRLLARCRERGWLKARGRQRTDSTDVVGAVRVLKSARTRGGNPASYPECAARRSRRTGSSSRSPPTGMSALVSASTTIACPKTRPNVRR